MRIFYYEALWDLRESTIERVEQVKRYLFQTV